MNTLTQIPSERRGLYPALEPRKHGYFEVGDGHALYWEECGNPAGIPVVFLHGGPGSGVSAYHRQFFDPTRYRIFLFDQRGAGRSRPHASLANNTTWDLVSDMEKLREFWGVDRWVVFGGSWGSTLSLSYAETHPERCLGLVLRGIFLCRKKELDWFYQFGAHHLFPDEWEKFLAAIPADERGALIPAYYKRLTSTDESVRLQAACAWARWEGATLKLIPSAEQIASFSEAQHALSLARIECHYFMNKAFFRNDQQLLEDAHRIQNIPTYIIHGRYDVVCPVENAWELHKVLPKAHFTIVPDAGHAANEPGIVDALVRATDALSVRR